MKINAISVPEPAREELERRFAARQGAVEGTPGFEGFQATVPARAANRSSKVARAGSGTVMALIFTTDIGVLSHRWRRARSTADLVMVRRQPALLVASSCLMHSRCARAPGMSD